MTSSQHLFIESDANPRLKRWRRLALEAKAVRREGATVLEGIHLLQTVLEHPEVKINAVMLPEGRTTAEAKALAERAAQTLGTRLYVLSDRLYDAISPVENGVGVMCEIALQPRRRRKNGPPRMPSTLTAFRMPAMSER